MSRLVFYIRSTLLKPQDDQARLLKAWPERERLVSEELPETCQVPVWYARDWAAAALLFC